MLEIVGKKRMGCFWRIKEEGKQGVSPNNNFSPFHINIVLLHGNRYY